MKPQDSLRQSADVFEERGRVYGDAYKRFGPVFAALFPNGVECAGPDDANRLGVFVQILSKIVRYANQFEAGGHDDSLLDLATYAAMLRELDAEGRAKEPSFSELLMAKAPFDPKPGREPESVVPRGSGFRVGEIEPGVGPTLARELRGEHGVGDGYDMVRE